MERIVRWVAGGGGLSRRGGGCRLGCAWAMRVCIYVCIVNVCVPVAVECAVKVGLRHVCGFRLRSHTSFLSSSHPSPALAAAVPVPGRRSPRRRPELRPLGARMRAHVFQVVAIYCVCVCESARACASASVYVGVWAHAHARAGKMFRVDTDMLPDDGHQSHRQSHVDTRQSRTHMRVPPLQESLPPVCSKLEG